MADPLYVKVSLLNNSNSFLIAGATASGGDGPEEQEGEVWRRRRSMQASGGGAVQNHEACGSRESASGIVVEREAGEMQGCLFII